MQMDEKKIYKMQQTVQKNRCAENIISIAIFMDNVINIAFFFRKLNEFFDPEVLVGILKKQSRSFPGNVKET